MCLGRDYRSAYPYIRHLYGFIYLWLDMKEIGGKEKEKDENESIFFNFYVMKNLM